MLFMFHSTQNFILFFIHDGIVFGIVIVTTEASLFDIIIIVTLHCSYSQYN